MQVSYPARIAVYDDAAAAPRVVIVDPKDPRAYLEEITATVVRLSKEQGGSIPFMVIREVVENFIHAYFIQPTISILDGGETIRFSDQGPGIKEKERALEYGTSSATEEMKQYIRGVGSGLPYAQQYMIDKGGSLTIEDNIAGGTVVTISSYPADDEPTQSYEGFASGQTQQMPYPAPQQNPYLQQPQRGYGAGPQYQPPAQQAPWPPQGYQQQGAQQQWGYQQPPAWGQQPWPQQAWGQQAYPPQDPYQNSYAQSAPQATSTPVPPAAPAPIALSDRGRMILGYLSQHESVGPTELTREFGSSQATWSRELGALESAGLIRKPRGEQKRMLTDAGRAFVATL